ALPAGLPEIRSVVFTPTFVVLHEGREIGRILGYSGEDFFWGLLEKILTDTNLLPPPQEHAAATPAALTTGR
ncbi:MAG: thioredoxin family protein, partial [Pseudomonadota bacterium]|nr:thioredoxin family protein [Pseudomonadota bacterium]